MSVLLEKAATTRDLLKLANFGDVYLKNRPNSLSERLEDYSHGRGIARDALTPGPLVGVPASLIATAQEKLLEQANLDNTVGNGSLLGAAIGAPTGAVAGAMLGYNMDDGLFTNRSERLGNAVKAALLLGGAGAIGGGALGGLLNAGTQMYGGLNSEKSLMDSLRGVKF